MVWYGLVWYLCLEMEEVEEKEKKKFKRKLLI